MDRKSLEVAVYEGFEWAESVLDDFLLHRSSSLLYTSLGFQRLIASYTGAASKHIVARSGGKILGLFSFMLSSENAIGRVANSLPYYGSNGGVIVDQELEESVAGIVYQAILDQFDELMQGSGILCSTIISNPLDPAFSAWMNEHYPSDYTDDRIGQITPLPSKTEEAEEALLGMYDNPRPRNIRKAIKEGVSVRWSRSREDMEFLFRTHQDNIKSIGGIPKEWRFFESVLEQSDALNFRIYVAEKNETPVSALLLFYFNKTVEYFTPATVHDYRNAQPSALIIHQSMIDAIEEGYDYYNWGGTWLTQEGVYGFKKKWGAGDNPYRYFTRIYVEELLKKSKEEILSEIPNFFVLPFNKLKHE
jgi:hypothetical protein